ncbi:hypothetical protein ACOMHN_000878 [Nucella lapillus]
MFRRKQDVDRHVSSILGRIKDEREKNAKGYQIARLYFEVGEFEIARRYLASYLSVRETVPQAFRLLGQIEEAVGNKENAVEAYRRFLDMGGTGKEVVLKICELYSDIGVDPGKGKYWLEKAEQLYPQSEVIFRLKEKLITASPGQSNDGDLEHLIASELLKKPHDLDLRIKLLRVYLDSDRLEEAYSHAKDTERTTAFSSCLKWYECLLEVLRAYQSQNDVRQDVEFVFHYLVVLCNLTYLRLADKDIVESAEALHSFDQAVQRATHLNNPSEQWEAFVTEMQGQLFFLAGTLLLKRAQNGSVSWSDMRPVAGVMYLLCQTVPTVDAQAAWFVCPAQDRQKLYAWLYSNSFFRMSQSGHTLYHLCQGDRATWAQRLQQQCCSPAGQERLYEALFPIRDMRSATAQSYLVNTHKFCNTPLAMPPRRQLYDVDRVAHTFHPDRLSEMVWLCLQQYSFGDPHQPDYNFKTFETLQYSVKNLENGAAETLCLLDTEAFLDATVRCAALQLKEQQLSVDGDVSRPPMLPLCLCKKLCSPEQEQWWRTAHNFYSNTIKENFSKMRHILQRGIEVVRLVGNHGLSSAMVVHLAKTFEAKVKSLAEGDHGTRGSVNQVACLEARAAFYWRHALAMLTRLEKNQRGPQVKVCLFDDGDDGDLTPATTQELLQDAKFASATIAMREGRYEDAIRGFERLTTPYASFYRAQIYKSMAQRELEGPGLEESRRQKYTALVSQARDALYLTMDHLGGNKNHELNILLTRELDDVESKLNCFEWETESSQRDELDEPSGLRTPVKHQNGHSMVTHPHSTPKSPSHHSQTVRQRLLLSEVTTDSPIQPQPVPVSSPAAHTRPSPERLDAQIKSINYSQTQLFKMVLDRNEELVVMYRGLLDQLNESNAQLKTALGDNHALMDELKGVLSTNKDTMTTMKSELAEAKDAIRQLKDDCQANVSAAAAAAAASSANMLSAQGLAASQMSAAGYFMGSPYHPSQYPLYPQAPQLTPGAGYRYPLLPGYPPRPNTPVAPPTAAAARISGTAPSSFGKFRGGDHHAEVMTTTEDEEEDEENGLSVCGSEYGEGLLQTPGAQYYVPAPDPSTGPADWMAGALHSGTGGLTYPAAVNPPPPQVPHPQVPQPGYFASALKGQSLQYSSSPAMPGPGFFSTPPPPTAAVLGGASQSAIMAALAAKQGLGHLAGQQQLPPQPQPIPVIGAGASKSPQPAFPSAKGPETQGLVILFQDFAKLTTTGEDMPTVDVRVIQDTATKQGSILVRKKDSVEILASHNIAVMRVVQSFTPTYFLWSVVAPGEKKLEETFRLTFESSEQVKKLRGAVEQVVKGAGIKPPASPAPTLSPAFGPKSPATQATMVDFPTRKDKTTLDIILTSHPSFKVRCKPLPSVGNSDHDIVLYDTALAPHRSRPPRRKIFLWKKADVEGMRQDVKEFANTYQYPDPSTPNALEQMWSDIKQMLSETVEKRVPSKTSASRHTNPWITTSIRRAIRRKQRAHKKARMTGKKKDVDRYRRIQAQTRYEVRQASRKYLEDVAVVSTLVRPPPASQTTPTAGGAGKATFGGFTFSSTPVIKPSDNAHTPEDRNKAKPSPQFKLKESAIKVPPSPTTTTTTPPTPTTTAATATSEATAPFAGFTFAPSKPVSSAFGSSVTPSTAAGSGVTGSGSSGKGQAFVFGQGSPEGATSFASLSGHSASEAFKSKEGGVGFQPSGQPLFTQSSSPVKAPRGREEDGVDEYEPNVDFRPIIDLPDLVETKTGEEDETKVLSDRAKLFRFDSDTSQWKERGIGELKILRSVGTPPRFRIIMRREQVLKVCANHFISGDMKLTPLSASDRTWIYTAHDYAEEEMRVEKFAAKFKNPDTAAHFKTVFENCQKEMAEAVEAATAAPPHPSAAVSAAATAPKSPVKTDAAKPSLAELFKPAAGSWECPGCCLSNAGDAAQCPACQTPQPGAPVPNTSTPAPDDSPFSSAAPFGTFSGLKLGVEASGQKSVFGGSGGAGAGASGGGFKFVSTPPVAEQTGKQPSLAELFKPAAGSWECPGCCLSNAGDAALCPACQTPQPGAPAPNTPAPDDSPFSSAAPSGTFGGLKLGAEPSGQKSVFGGSGGAGAGTSGGGFKFVSTPPVAEQTGKQPSLAEMFKPAAGSWECPGCCLSNAGEAAQCPACQTPQPGAPTPTPAPDDSPFSSAAPTGTFGGLKLGAGAGATKTDDAKPAFPASGFKFGASPASASTEAAGFKFTPSKPAESTTTANPGGFKFTFGTQSGSVFGGTQSSASNVSAATTAPTQGATTVATTSNAATTTATAKPGFVFGGGAAATTAEASGTGFSFSTDAPATQESAGKDSGFSFAKPQPPPAQPAEKSEPCSGLLKQLLTTEDEPESTTPKPSLFGSAAIATPTASESPQPSGFQARLGQVTSPTTETQADGTTKAGFQFTFSLQKQQQSPHQASSSRSPEVNDQGFYLNKEGEDSHIYFEPVVSLPEKADIKTGEEDEETLFESRAKLYRFTNAEWKERGLGTLKILRHKNTCRIRLLMRREQVLKICCNHYITGELDLKPMPRSDGKAWVWYALDFTEGPGHMEQFAVRFRDVDTAGRFKAVFDESKEKMKTPSKADIKMLDPTAANSAERSSVPRRLFTEEGDGSDVVFLYEETPTPEQVARARKLQLPDTFYLYENRPGCPGCIGCEDSSRSPVAAAAPIESPKAVTVTATSAASTQAVTVTPTQAVTVTPTQAVTVTPTQAVTVTPTQAVTMTPTRAARQPAQEATVGKASEDRMFAKTTGTSFSALAATSGETPTFGPRDPSKPFHWAGAGQRLFGKGVGGGGEGGEEGEVVACDDIHFEPVIPLPDLVEVKTGEEDWGPLFAQRAKVYRYDGTQWKERGVGEMKIMKHVSQSLFRVLLRREQVLKVACNHLISTVMELKPMATSESAWCWVANDCSEGEPKLEKFAVKFKKVEVAKEFKAIFEDCQEKLREGEQKSAGQETMVSSSAHPTGNRGNVRHTQAIAVATQDAMTTSSQPACGDKGRALYGQEPTAGGDKGRALDGQEPTAGGQDWAVSSTQAVEGGDRGNPCVAQAPDVAAQDAQVTSTTLPPLAAGGGNPLFSTLLSPEEGWEVSEAAETGSTVSGTQAGEGGTTHLHSAALDTFTARVTTPLGDRGNAYHTREIESGCKDTEAEQEAKILGGVGNVCYTKQLDVSSQDKMVQRSAASLGDKGNVCYTQQLDVSSQDTMAQRSAASLGDKGNVCYTQQLDVSGLDTMTKRDVESLGDKGSVCYTKEGDVSAEDTMARHDAVSQGDTGNVYYTQQLNVSAQDTMAQRSTTSLGDKGNVYYTKQLDVSPQDTVTQTDRTGNTGQARDGSQAVDTASEHTTAKPVYAPQGTQGTAPASPEAGGKQRHGRGRRGLVFYPGRMESELLGTEAEEQYDDEDYDDDDEDEDESTEEEDDEEEMVEFDKRATMFRKGDDDQWEKLGMGNLRVLYDDDLNANKLVFLTDKGDKVCNHVIAMELTVATDGKKKTCEWQPVDYSTDEPVNRHFKAYFSSTQSMDDFATIFRQGQKLAAESGISVKLPEEIEVPEVFSTGDRSEGPMGKK